MKPRGGTMLGMSRTVTGDRTSEFEHMQIREHDFPQRIIYRRLADSSLQARIEGKRVGKLQGVDFPMRPPACGEGLR